MNQYFTSKHTFKLESGAELDSIQIAYRIYGNPDADKTIWVCHALSGSPQVADWWEGLFGKDKLFNFSDYRIVCANVLGSCYGSTGPEDFDAPQDFPLISIRDMVDAHVLLRKHLSIENVDILIGASLGGQQALEWSIQEPNIFDKLILIATNAVHSPYGIAFNEAQRLALQADPTFGDKDGGEAGLKAARAIAMLSYRSYDDFTIKQSEENSKLEDFRAASYVRYQGEKFLSRFKASAYFTLSKSMDSHDVGRNRGGLEIALSLVKAKVLVVGVDSDVLFPLTEQEFLAEHIPHAQLGVIKSKYGHDAFLIEYQQLELLIQKFLNESGGSNNPKGHGDPLKLYQNQPTVLKTINR